ncbi:radical SAM family heme chaperone HemW [Chloroflexota bacterium]
MKPGHCPAPLGLYIHIPFCRAKCTYCDFNSYAGLDPLFEAYTAALVRELEQAGPARVQTLYLGGGTPTLLPPLLLERILDAARSTLPVDGQAEVSIEANPGTMDVGGLAKLRASGVNRLSLGIQSFDERELQLLGRIHTAAEAIEGFRAARRSGFGNISIDLIYGLPGQSPGTWQTTLERGLSLQPDHLSLYALTIEDGTPLARSIAGGSLPAPDPDLAAEMYELAADALLAAGWVHYEISNWARAPRYRCRHNLGYWHNEAYLGIGAGAHSWFKGRRWANVTAPREYTAQALRGERPVAMEETIDPPLEMGETMFMGLRLLDEGVAFERFRRRFGLDPRQQYADELAELSELGLIVIYDERVTLSRRGRLLGNQVFLHFLPE